MGLKCGFKERERLHFLKRLLNVNQTTCNAFAYGELGRYLLYINRYVRIIKYVYDQAVKDGNNGCHNWVYEYNVKKLLVDNDFVDIFENAHVLNTKSFPSVFEKKVIKMYKHEWYDTVNNSTVMDLYIKIFKPDFGYDMYLDVFPKSLKYSFLDYVCLYTL